MRPTLIVVLCVAVMVSFSTSASAGRIFGDISVDGKPLPAGIKVKVTRPGGTAIADTSVTDKFGSYKLLVKEEGKAVLTLLYQKTPLELAVFSTKEAARYDLVVEKKDGKLSLRRK